MEKDARLHFRLVLCAGCKKNTHALEHFYNENGRKYVIIICRGCGHVYGEREMTSEERRHCWTN